MKHKLFALIALALLPCFANAQQWTGTTGMLHIPSADMSQAGDLRIGSHFLNKNTSPDTGFLYLGTPYHTYNYYLSATPFSWIELSLVSTARKNHNNGGLSDYGGKDRHISVKVRPITEGRLRPAIAFGCDDAGTTIFNPNRSDVQLYFSNVYVAATKHFDLGGNKLGANIAYRHYYRGYNSKWNGLVGALSFSPACLPTTRAIVEYTGNEWLLGMDAVLFKHITLQASLHNFKYFNAGICLQFNLL